MNGEDICLMPGDFAYIPPDTIHSYEFVSHSNKMLVLLLPGEIEQVYEQFEESPSPSICPYFLFKKGTSCSIGRLQLNMICFLSKRLTV
ncbi:hypothetical protein BsIDN1_04570 [Bacillus safensis]|uniref:Uncharacterized protein n=1 Tax=Bacillus safensis TaxID=561879 RepID=A0A5S9M4K9_BACIA|nr:hypothetical protein BsIDN1_04570 [Bacillus safensis]